MGLLDSIVAKSFRDEKAGRVVVFTGDRRNRGYVVKSESEELEDQIFSKDVLFRSFFHFFTRAAGSKCVVDFSHQYTCIRQASCAFTEISGHLSGDLFSCGVSPVFLALEII